MPNQVKKIFTVRTLTLKGDLTLRFGTEGEAQRFRRTIRRYMMEKKLILSPELVRRIAKVSLAAKNQPTEKSYHDMCDMLVGKNLS